MHITMHVHVRLLNSADRTEPEVRIVSDWAAVYPTKWITVGQLLFMHIYILICVYVYTYLCTCNSFAQLGVFANDCKYNIQQYTVVIVHTHMCIRVYVSVYMQ